MASDPARPSLLIAADSHGAYLVSVRGDEADRSHWETWLIDEEGTHGPRELGNWIRFVPSDYAETEGPYAPEVQALIDRLRA